MKNMYIRHFIFVFVSIFAVQHASADWQVWTVTQTKRVLRSDPAGSTISVNLSAARNEWESFQILIRSDEDIKGINVVPGDLKGPRGAILPAGDTRLYRQHQLEITVGTHRNNEFVPDWYPDPLIPFRHPLTRKRLGNARFKAVPFDLPAGQTHGFWVDIYVPSNTRAGEYHGTYLVKARGGKAVEIPVSLTV